MLAMKYQKDKVKKKKKVLFKITLKKKYLGYLNKSNQGGERLRH